MSDTPTPEAGTLEGHIKDFVEMDLQIADLRATIAAKDRLLERMAGALREIVPDNWEDCPELYNGRIAGEYTFGDAREARAALKEYAETSPNPA